MVTLGFFFSGGCIYRPCRWISSTTKTHYVPLKGGACSWIFSNSQRWHKDLLMCLILPAVSKWSAKIIEQQLEEVMKPTGSLQSKCYPNSVIEERWGLNRAQFKWIYFRLNLRRAACPYCYHSWCANIFAKYRTSTWFSGTGLGFNRSPDTTHTGLCSAARLHLARRVCEEDPARYFKVISCRSLTSRILWEFW